jgi:FMN phosphatase YigB (HAD superfamily)
VITSVVFDIGETLLDDTREHAAWADWIGVPRHTFSAALGAVTAQGRDNAETFQYFRPGFDPAAERQRREDAGRGERIDDSDLYPDVRPALGELRARGVWVGIAGNQTARAAVLLRVLDLPAEAIATSGEWGLAKPAPGFFDRVVDFAPGEPAEIVYVGDHRDHWRCATAIWVTDIDGQRDLVDLRGGGSEHRAAVDAFGNCHLP